MLFTLNKYIGKREVKTITNKHTQLLQEQLLIIIYSVQSFFTSYLQTKIGDKYIFNHGQSYSFYTLTSKLLSISVV